MHVYRLQASFINIQTKPNTIGLNIFGFLLGELDWDDYHMCLSSLFCRDDKLWH